MHVIAAKVFFDHDITERASLVEGGDSHGSAIGANKVFSLWNILRTLLLAVDLGLITSKTPTIIVLSLESIDCGDESKSRPIKPSHDLGRRESRAKRTSQMIGIANVACLKICRIPVSKAFSTSLCGAGGGTSMQIDLGKIAEAQVTGIGLDGEGGRKFFQKGEDFELI